MQTLTDELAKVMTKPEDAKEVFKKWLKEIPLGAVYKHSVIASNMRHDLIIMVDEP